MFESRAAGPVIRDVRVGPIMVKVAEACRRMGLRVDTAQLHVPRMFIDAARPPPGVTNLDPDKPGELAYTDPRLALIYDRYIRGIELLLARSISTFSREDIALFDLHGFSRGTYQLPYDLVLGTANRRTILPRGDMDLRFAESMWKKGWKLFLPGEAPIGPMSDPYDAGHFVRWVFQKWCVNVIQMEIASEWRFGEGFTEEKRDRLVADIAGTLVEIFGQD